MAWIRAFHIIFMVTWFAGLFYLPRLFVYHALCEDETGSQRFKLMERKLIRAIINPSMIAVWILGPTLAWVTGAYLDLWLQIKFVLVIILSGIHGFLVRCWRDFEADRNTRSERFYRVINEVPALLMIFIVILVVVKPFS